MRRAEAPDSSETGTAIESGLPVVRLNELARLESFNKNTYRPATYIHKWWARRLGSVFRTILLGVFSPAKENLWRRYYEGTDFNGKTVLDPFMGGGTTVVEALRLGCKVVGIDLNPVAWWTVKEIVTPVDLDALDATFQDLERQVKDQIISNYRTRCPSCFEFADVLYYLWVKTVPCANCRKPVRLHPSFVVRHDQESATIVCPFCGRISSCQDPDSDVLCRGCNQRFVPDRGSVSNGIARCYRCSREIRILDVIRRRKGPLPELIYAVRYRCRKHGEGFKQPDPLDLKLYKKAEQVFRKRRRQLHFPRQRIPDGEKTAEALQHGYTHWHQLFNARQLLSLDCLLRGIMRIRNQTLRELFLTLFSGCLEFNNMFCSYKGQHVRRPGAVRHIFAHHAYVFPYESLENNVWGDVSQSGTFPALYRDRLLEGKAYCQAPSERVVHASRTVRKLRIPEERIHGKIANSFLELVSSEKNVLLLCQDSARLPLPDCAIDAVVTDPPYFDNVMYAELADFFYVWLRLALGHRYKVFRPPLTPKTTEIVKNTSRGLSAQHYQQGLTRVFRECGRVLKNDGLLVFTFHHKNLDAWCTVLQAVLDAGFLVRATYAVHAEMQISVHLIGQKAMSYDAIIVCRKRDVTPTRLSWRDLEAQVVVQAQRAYEILQQANGELSPLDASVIVLGKCLEIYSSAYPEIWDEDRQIPVKEAIRRMESLVELLVANQKVKASTSTELQPYQLSLL